jgi:hypothetical protein
VQERLRSDAVGGVHTHIVAPMAANDEELMRTLNAVSPNTFSF